MSYSGISLADKTRGLADERRVKQWLAKRYQVQEATKYDQIHYDIDCWVDGKAVSIKSQQAGTSYRNVCLELLTEQQNKVSWEPDIIEKALSLPGLLEQAGSVEYVVNRYRPAWFLFGRADTYLFLFCNKLYVVPTDTLLSHVVQGGFSHYRTLGKERLAGQGGRNALSGYLGWDGLPGKFLFL